ncbi:MAG: hypothetical protein U9P71_00580 [Campylobacterota bacterium]|nr:hypothetical protein [Campylobacterota bacterium]
MNSFFKLTLSSLLLSSSLVTAEELDLDSIALQAHLLGTQELSVTGEFAQYDFVGVETAFDWTFSTANGTVYQLQGKEPSATDVFGWKQVTVTPSEASWYMSYLGDWDNDGDGRFDWLLVGNGSNAVYKLAGVTDSGNFAYSSKINVPYSVSGDKTKITFGDENTPQLSVTYPTSGDIAVHVEQTNGSSYMDYYEDSIVGNIDGQALEVLYSEGNPTEFSIGTTKITYIYNADETINFKFYSNNLLEFESSNVATKKVTNLSDEDFRALVIVLFAMMREQKKDYDDAYTIQMFMYSLLTHEAIREVLNIETVTTDEPPTDEPSTTEDIPEGVITIHIINFANNLEDYWQGYYLTYDQCSAVYTESSYYQIEIGPATVSCLYTDDGDYKGNRVWNIDGDSNSRFTTVLQEPYISMSRSTDTFHSSATIKNGKYSSFKNDIISDGDYIDEYILHIDEDSMNLYFYTDYIELYQAKFKADGKLSQFCTITESGELLSCENY